MAADCRPDSRQISNATISAAEKSLNLAAEDTGLVETIWLLTQLPLAARSEDFTSSLRKAGLDVSDTPSLMEIVGALTDTIDARLSQNGGRTDLGEMAQMAADFAHAAMQKICSKLKEDARCCPGLRHRDRKGKEINR